jgi:hypothetical protein
MIREVFPFANLGVVPGVKSVLVEMDKEGFDQLLDSYKYAWERRNMLWLLGDDVSCMQFVCQVLKAAEEACIKEEL